MTRMGQYPDTFYRVSLKALIRNSRGEVLVVKEYEANTWSLPGGGIDHGESDEQCLKRELKEEVGFKGEIIGKRILGIETMYLETKDAVLMWIVYELELDNDDFCTGEHCNDVKFIKPDLLSDSKAECEAWVYKFANL